MEPVMDAAAIARESVLTPSPSAAPDDVRYEAVRRRDPAFDGAFVYAVRTTGVYCRPTCASRLAKRGNVAFFSSGEAAAAAGFRACKRCRPDEASEGARRSEAVARACNLIETAEEMPNLDDLARTAKLSRFHFHRVFKAATGLTPKAYAGARRAERMREGLASAGSVTEAIYDAGYNASSRFYEESARELGMTPRAFKDGGRGAKIRFAIGQCSLGAILVAATGTGVSAILIGDDPERLARDLQDQFPKAELVGADAAFEATVARVVGLIEGEAPSLGLPLDIRGTAFQRRVWDELSRIPSGETRTYAEIAAAIGRPEAVRAVAGACASNRLAVAIPCHRVVRRDGSLSGYRWGVERKRELIERERARA
jgi:AraC family transcriptional regulator of adaptative response/methylated-DNA-[protein]-cysteine methyltransferase